MTSHAEKPFVIRADHAIVEVLGTRFNVRAWQSEQRVSVAVAAGKVELSSTGKDRKAVEQPLGNVPRKIPLAEPTRAPFAAL